MIQHVSTETRLNHAVLHLGCPKEERPVGRVGKPLETVEAETVPNYELPPVSLYQMAYSGYTA